MMFYIYSFSIEQTLAELERWQGKARIIAGGTDLMVDLREGKRSAECLVDITRVPGLEQITLQDGWITVGAAVTFAAIHRLPCAATQSPLLRGRVHVLVEAAQALGALPIQITATWVGNLVQAMPAADGAIAAVALQVQAQVVDCRGAQWVGVETLFAGPGISTIDPTRQLITHLRFAAPRAGWGSAWMRVGRRASLVLPTLNCAVTIQLADDQQTIRAATIALGPVAPTPFRARAAQAALLDQPATVELFEHAGRLAQSETQPRSNPLRASSDYRRELVAILVRDSLSCAAARARQSFASFRVL